MSDSGNNADSNTDSKEAGKRSHHEKKTMLESAKAYISENMTEENMKKAAMSATVLALIVALQTAVVKYTYNETLPSMNKSFKKIGLRQALLLVILLFVLFPRVPLIA